MCHGYHNTIFHLFYFFGLYECYNQPSGKKQQRQKRFCDSNINRLWGIGEGRVMDVEEAGLLEPSWV